MKGLLGTAVLTGIGVGVAEAPVFTSAPPAITEPCIPTDVHALPDQSETGNVAQASAYVETMHLFMSAREYDGLDSGVETTLNRRIAKIDRSVPRGKMPTPKQTEEVTTAYNQEYAGQAELSKQYLADHGITLSVAGKFTAEEWAVSYGEVETSIGQDPNSYLLSFLSDFPSSIVEASGLKHIIINPADITKDQSWSVSKTDPGTLEIGSGMDLYQGLSKMLLDSCPDKQAVLYSLSALNGNQQYSPDINVSYNEFQDKYSQDFISQEAMRSPEEEFVEIFADTLYGENWYGSAAPTSILGQKQQVVQSIFDRFVPGGDNYEKFTQFLNTYQNDGDWQLQDVARQLPGYVKLLNSANSPQQREAVKNLWEEGLTVNVIEASLKGTLPGPK
jgi:hypothetical protein